MSNYKIIRNIMDKNITAEINILDKGVNILLVGGDTTCIGAIGLADEKGVVQMIEVSGDGMGIMCKKWVEKITRQIGQPVSLTVGIHYNNISNEQNNQLVTATDEMLIHALEYIKVEQAL